MKKNGGSSQNSTAAAKTLAILTIALTVIIGASLGVSLAATINIKNQENFFEFAPALPTKILDIHGTLITEFFADEKREMVRVDELPRHLILAVLAREDPQFYSHRGFSVKGIIRAAFGQLIGKSLGGGSTITQQVAGTRYLNRTQRTISRKIKELWWALQMERQYTKNEILEIYFNQINMGPGVNGVEATSEYFFGHSAREVTLAEAALLAVLPSSPSRFNPLKNPNEAMDRQRFVLERMINFGFTTQEEAEASFNEYWENYDYTRESTAAYYHREDKAPWFSEYIRRELDTMMYGSMNYYRDGYTVHTTLDLRHQEAAEKFMAEGLARANREYSRSRGRSNVQAERTFIPIVDMLTLCFNLSDIHATSSAQNEHKALSRYTKTINPIVDMAALTLGVPDLKVITNAGFGGLKTTIEQNVVEGALISIENQTGYITAIVGGSKYDESNQLIRATQASIQPGSSFKPLYYSAAIDTKKFTAASLIYDVPIVFHNEDGTPYIPLNFRGVWEGSVLLYDALAHSMNVPSLKILDTIGFDTAIDRAAALLDITDPDKIRQTFPRVYPLGLGINTASPLQMARAFSVFGNEGREVTPIAIRSIEDRNGRVILDVERDIRQQQRRTGNRQIISPQNAYIMTRILEKTVEEGSLANGAGYGVKFTFRDENGKSFRMPVAGKTGTTQNWSDAWAVGYSPYYTTATWFGFDKPGNSLGTELTGSTLNGPVWGNYMREIHQGLPRRDFTRPAEGIIEVTVCAKSGQLRTPACNEGEVTLPFLIGTQPTHTCDIHGGGSWTATTALNTMRDETISMDEDVLFESLTMPSLPQELIPEPQNNRNRNLRNNRNNNRRNLNNQRAEPETPSLPPITWSFNNPLLDGYDPSNSPETEIGTEYNDYFGGVEPSQLPPEESSFIPEPPPEAVPAIPVPVTVPAPSAAGAAAMPISPDTSAAAVTVQPVQEQPESVQNAAVRENQAGETAASQGTVPVMEPEIPSYNPLLD